MTTPQAAGPLVIASCSRRKTAATEPVPALDLYQGGCIPALRARVTGRPALRARVRIISAEHGLLHADTPVLPYDRRMDARRALALRAPVDEALQSEWLLNGRPREVLVIAGPLYMLALAGLYLVLGPVWVRWISDPGTGWPEATAILDDWSWPCP